MNIYNSFQDVKADLQQGKVTCSSLVSDYVQRIESLKKINAFIEVFEEEAKQQARIVDQKLKDGSAGRLAGMVLGIKDNINYKGHHTSAASRMLEDFKPLYSATAVDRLLAEDAIIIGRLNCDEFAMGGSNENSAFGPVLNPYDNSCVPGGSSGGSAAAVAAGLCHAALGSDTGGSVRQPGAFCGVFGLKPTYGRVSRYGLIAFASSFDQIGILSRSVEDAALLLEIIAGNDVHDNTSSTLPVEPYDEEILKERKFRVAVIRQCKEAAGLDPEIKQSLNDLIEQLAEQGHPVDVIEFPLLDKMVPAYYVLTTAEASSNLSRYSGLLFGHRTRLKKGLEETISHSRSEGFGKEVKRRILLGTFVLSAGYFDAYFTKAQQVRRMLVDKTSQIFNDFDAIILPTSPTTAFNIGEKNDDPIAMYLADIYTVFANLTGLPAISVPLYKHSNGMPFGLQVITNKMDEVTLFQLSSLLMQNY